jgi:protein SCO1/2
VIRSGLAAVVLLAGLAIAGQGGRALAQPGLDTGARSIPNTLPLQLEEVGVDEHLGWQLPEDAIFRDHHGRMVRLGDYFDGRRPVVLNLAYYRCPALCGMVQQATLRALREQEWTIGEEYQVVTISIDPTDTPASATEKRNSLIAQYGRAGTEDDWPFLSGDATQIARVARAAGFRYTYDARQNEYAHAAVVMLATPDGKMARYLYGLQFDPLDVRLGLLEASQGRSISTVERVLLYCYRYDADAQGYVVMATRVMQIGGGLTALILGAFLFFLWRRELRRRRNVSGPPGPEQLESVQA